MKDIDPCAQLLGITSLWYVEKVEIDNDKKHRRWKHLNTCQYKTFVEADVPRIECAGHKIREVRVP